MPQLARPAVFVEGPHEVFVIEGSSMMIFGLLFLIIEGTFNSHTRVFDVLAKNLELYCLNCLKSSPNM